MAAAASAQQVGDWMVEYADAAGKPRVSRVSGKLVLQEHWTLIMDPSSKGIVFAVPAGNTSNVRPAD